MAKNTLVEAMVADIMNQNRGSMEDLGNEAPVRRKPQTQKPVQTPMLTEEEKLVIRQARSAKQGRPTNAQRAAFEVNPQERKKAIGVQIAESLYLRLDKALARTGKTKRDFIEGLLEKEFKKLGI